MAYQGQKMANFGGQGRPQADDALWQQFMGADQAGKLALTSRANGSDQYNAIRRRAIAEGFVPDTNGFQAYFSQLGVPGFSGNPADVPGMGGSMTPRGVPAGMGARGMAAVGGGAKPLMGDAAAGAGASGQFNPGGAGMGQGFSPNLGQPNPQMMAAVLRRMAQTGASPGMDSQGMGGASGGSMNVGSALPLAGGSFAGLNRQMFPPATGTVGAGTSQQAQGAFMGPWGQQMNYPQAAGGAGMPAAGAGGFSWY